MRTALSCCVLITAVAVNVSCRGVLSPSCTDEAGEVLRTEGLVQKDGTSSHTVISPKSSNLLIRLTWTDTQATLGVSATTTDCGGHTGCAMATTTPPPGPGGSSPVPQAWPAGVREMLVDGWRGKTHRIDISGDSTRDATFAPTATYRITCER